MLKHLLLPILFLVSLSFSTAAQSPIDVAIEQTLASIKSVKSARYTFKNTERIQGQLLTGEQVISYIAQPYQVMLEFVAPRKGTSIYFQQGKNNNKLVYDPVGFPYTKIYLDPLGDLARDRNHHTIFEVGFSSMGKIITHLHSNYPQYFKMLPDEAKLGKQLMKIEFDYAGYALVKHQVGADQSTKTIADQYFVNEYALLERNKHVKEFGKLKPGTVIDVPNCYAKKMIVWIDKMSKLPVMMELYDDLGLYEQYIYTNVQYNDPSIDQEMLRRSKEYVQ